MSEKIIGRIWVLDKYDLKITPEIWKDKKLKKALLRCIDESVKEDEG